MVPLEQLHLVYDGFIKERWNFLYKACLAIFIYHKEALISLDEPGDILALLSPTNDCKQDYDWEDIIIYANSITLWSSTFLLPIYSISTSLYLPPPPAYNITGFSLSHIPIFSIILLFGGLARGGCTHMLLNQEVTVLLVRLLNINGIDNHTVIPERGRRLAHSRSARSQVLNRIWGLIGPSCGRNDCYRSSDHIWPSIPYATHFPHHAVTLRQAPPSSRSYHLFLEWVLQWSCCRKRGIVPGRRIAANNKASLPRVTTLSHPIDTAER